MGARFHPTHGFPSPWTQITKLVVPPPPPQTLQVPTMMFAPSYNFITHGADVILRAPLQQGSTQFKDFHTHKSILSVASTLFHGMFSLPQPAQLATGDVTLPIVQVTESAEVFEVFLLLTYPVEPPAITSLQLVSELFQIAEKYVANGVHARLKQILVSSPLFLRDDPIGVYALACRANLDAEAGLAIPLTFKIDPVRDIPHTHLRMMTTETYNRLLTAHATRRDVLVSLINRAKVPPHEGCSCGSWFYTRLGCNITLAIWERPFLDRRRLDSCLPESTSTESRCGSGSGCRASEQVISGYFTNILDEIGKLE